MSPMQRQGPAMLTSIHSLLSSWGRSQAVFLTCLQFWAKLWSVGCGPILAATGTTFKAVSRTLLAVSQSKNVQGSVEVRATRWKEPGILEKSHLPIRNTQEVDFL